MPSNVSNTVLGTDKQSVASAKGNANGKGLGQDMPDPFAPGVKLVNTRTITVSTLIVVEGYRYEITRLAVGPRETARATLLGDQYWHQGVAVAVDANGFAQESCQLVYPKTVFIPKYLPAAMLAMEIAPGSQWKVETYR